MFSRTLQRTSGLFSLPIAPIFDSFLKVLLTLLLYLLSMCLLSISISTLCIYTVLCIRRTFSISQTFSILFLFPLCRLQPASAPLYCSDISFLQVGASTYTEAGYLDSRSCMIVDSYQQIVLVDISRQQTVLVDISRQQIVLVDSKQQIIWRAGREYPRRNGIIIVNIGFPYIISMVTSSSNLRYIPNI